MAPKNSAFVFLKPHAVTDACKALVKQRLADEGIQVVGEGALGAAEIDEKRLIDQHYYAIASKATILKPEQMPVPAERFRRKFSLGWKEALEKGVVLNAMDACAYLELDAAGLEKAWRRAKEGGNMVKFGGGFYCGLVEVPGKEAVYVFNGFFMSMRETFVRPGASIHYYVVEWEAAKLSWADFRGKLLGPTDPAEAPAGSLRGAIYGRWKELGLKSKPGGGDNGVHASASPFEALAERMNWLGVAPEKDEFGRELLKAGVSKKTLKAWTTDPQVTFGPVPITTSLFDMLEDMDTDMCLAQAAMINGQVFPTAHCATSFAVGLGAGYLLWKMLR